MTQGQKARKTFLKLFVSIGIAIILLASLKFFLVSHPVNICEIEQTIKQQPETKADANDRMQNAAYAHLGDR